MKKNKLKEKSRKVTNECEKKRYTENSIEKQREDFIMYFKKCGVYNQSDAETLAHDVMQRPDGKQNLRYALLEYRRQKAKEKERFVYLDATTSKTNESLTILSTIPFIEKNFEAFEMREHQRQLIFALVESEDDLAKAVVNAYLTVENPTYKNIGDMLDIPFKRVDRILKRLKKNYDAEKFGELSSYFNAS